MKKFDVVIVGAGTGGLMSASFLRKKAPQLSVCVIDPAQTHWYQPAWTLVGAGTFSMKKTAKPTKTLIPHGVTWIPERVVDFTPEANHVLLENGERIDYRGLILSPGLVMDLDGIDGLREALDHPNVCSNYTDPEKTWTVLQNFRGGNALFTQPNTPIKCGGAPQKIMYLAEDYFRKKGIRDQSHVIYATPGSVIFGMKEVAQTLNEIIAHRTIHFKPFYAPIRIDAARQQVTFQYIATSGNACLINQGANLNEEMVSDHTVVVPYDMLHLAPPQNAPDFIRNSPFAVQEGPGKGWLDVDIHTLRTKKYPNVFGIGDAAALPTAKTGAALRKQVPVAVYHLVAQLGGFSSDRTYEGYSSCPLVTRYGRMVLAEFKYDNVPDPDPVLSKFMNTFKEQWLLWILKKYGLPFLYWNQMLKGKMMK
jgi:sulfide:quinone oxidoreductase